jgi:hypothetical protein
MDFGHHRYVQRFSGVTFQWAHQYRGGRVKQLREDARARERMDAAAASCCDTPDIGQTRLLVEAFSWNHSDICRT